MLFHLIVFQVFYLDLIVFKFLVEEGLQFILLCFQMLQLPIHICNFNALLEDVVGQVDQVLKFHFSLFFIIHASRHDAGRWRHGLGCCLIFLEDAIERAEFLLWKFTVSIARSKVVLPITFDSAITAVVALPSY